jgi:hypothetical protein
MVTGAMCFSETLTSTYNLYSVTTKNNYVTIFFVDLGGPVIIVLAVGSKVRGFKPGQWKLIFKGDKNSYHDFLRREIKAVGPMS